MSLGIKTWGRERRKLRVRKKVLGTEERPRLNVFRSARHVYAQVIDDVRGVTLASASTVEKELRGSIKGKKSERAKAVGIAVAKACKEKSIEKVVFDRNGFRYHGRVAAVAAGAREGGLQF
ncbi:MAG: 50S ribosomal protein L18 [Deltaproteobacteria bacterium]|nr:50S ribosomal protein L18 [Deltaproteobacteria bacterium]